MPENIDVSLATIRPFVRFARSLTVSKGEYPTPTAAYDCRLFYASKGEGTMLMGERTYAVKRGDLLMWQPGTPYRMDTHDANSLEFLGINFDFTQSFRDWQFAFPPVKMTAYDKAKPQEHVVFSDVPRFNEPLYVQGMQTLEDALQEVKMESQVKRAYSFERMSGLMVSLLSTLARKLVLGQVEQIESEKKIERVLDYIHAHYAEEITNEALGARFNYHPNYLNKLMVLYNEKSLHQYLLDYRISKAIELIMYTDTPLSEIAEAVGFGDYCHFSKLFKQKVGSSPRDFRRVKQ